VNLDHRIKVRIHEAAEVLDLRIKSLSEESLQLVLGPFLQFKKEINSRLIKNEEYIGLLHQEFN
jgi:hypothetical protein